MACPYLKRVVMAYCSAYPVKKLVPCDRMTTPCKCLGEDFGCCPLFQELTARLGVDDGVYPDPAQESAPEPAAGKEDPA